MASSGVNEYSCPSKRQRLDIALGESKSSATNTNPNFPLRFFDPYDDECLRQYISYYYQFHKSEGFVIDWNKLEYKFDTMPIMDPFRAGRKTNDEIIRDVACRAISQHNADEGTKLEFVDHVSASYRWDSGVLYWITFWARDLASSNPEPKLYQTKCRRCGPTLCEIHIFRLKPSDEEIAAVQVDPPPPLNVYFPHENPFTLSLGLEFSELPTILFTVTGPGSGSIPDVAFTRIPPEVECVSSPDSS